MPQIEERSPGIDNSGEPTPASRIGDYYLFVVAIDNYDQSPDSPKFAKLNNPVLDASRVVKVLTTKYTFHKPKKGIDLSDQYPDYEVPVIEYDDIRTKCLYNENATQDAIISHLKDVAKEIKEDDCFLIYFAGHGTNIDDEGFLIPFDGINKDTKYKSWLGIGDFEKNFKDFPKNKKCRHLLMVLDCCYAGASFLGYKEGVGGDFSRFILTSSGTDQKASDGEPMKGSPFANAFYNYLNKDDNVPPIIIQKKKLNGFFVREWNGDTSKQKIHYTRLPGKNGTGEFIFQLDPKKEIETSKLANSLTKNLNFGNEKAALENYLESGEADEVYIISSVFSCEEVRKFFKKVVINKLDDFDDFTFPLDPYYYRIPLFLKSKEAAQNNWTFLNQELAHTAKTSKEEFIVNRIIGLLKGHRIPEQPLRPVILAIEYSGTDNILKELLGFCKEIIDLFRKKKDQLIKPTEKLGKFFIFLADMRDQGSAFKERTELVDVLGTYPNIIVTSKIESIRKTHFERWIDLAKPAFQPYPAIQNLTPSSIFEKRGEAYELFDFIAKLEEKCYDTNSDKLKQYFIGFEEKSF